MSFSLPISERTKDFNLVNLDKKGQPELIVKGEILIYDSGGWTSKKGMFIVNIDSIPTQIFKTYYSCWDEKIDDPNNNSEGVYTKGDTRGIKIIGTTIIISPIDKKKYPSNTDCSLTNIPSGTYVMESGRIRKKK